MHGPDRGELPILSGRTCGLAAGADATPDRRPIQATTRPSGVDVRLRRSESIPDELGSGPVLLVSAPGQTGRFGELCKPEVGHDDAVVVSEQQAAGVEVQVKDAVVVDGGHRL